MGKHFKIGDWVIDTWDGNKKYRVTCSTFFPLPNESYTQVLKEGVPKLVPTDHLMDLASFAVEEMLRDDPTTA